MLVFNIKRIMNLRGIDKPYAYLVKAGFHRTIANNLANNRAANIKISHLEKICRSLNCTPNDLFEWQTEANDFIVESHSLNSLKRDKPAPKLSRIVKDIPVEKLDKIEALLNQLKDEK